jgi:hypothetical protein
MLRAKLKEVSVTGASSSDVPAQSIPDALLSVSPKGVPTGTHTVAYRRPDGTVESFCRGGYSSANATFVNLMIALPAGTEVMLWDGETALARCVVLSV